MAFSRYGIVLLLGLSVLGKADAQVSADRPVLQGQLPLPGRVIQVAPATPAAAPAPIAPQAVPQATPMAPGASYTSSEPIPGTRKLRYPFVVSAEKEGNGHRIMATNHGNVPISVMAFLKNAENTVSETRWPVFQVVPANSVALLGRARADAPGIKYTFQIQSSWVPGDFNVEHNPDVLYRLPYRDGKTFRIGQSPGGKITTHTTPGSAFAVDIPMPEGTTIVAARGGVVVDTEDAQIESGTTPEMLKKANSIRILHQDGTLATYAHLAPKGVFVYPGQRVVAGAEIGLSGNTGYSSGPHLHFAVLQVKRNPDSLTMVSVPFKFYVGNPPTPFSPRLGMVATASYSSAASVPTVEAGRQENRIQIPATAQPVAPVSGTIYRPSALGEPAR